ncbi:hypothetical protein TheveDRAFT_1139 [Thermanaerovibrio velox DSM 12556]|uniref:Uncharacterized protein n=1 Tax=Thermanaerovibrio velox DSM 12556 TaxID=926567 RepID=H0USH4_9BACT|nr:hypothetical protein [Thermanaerovibrio velox]EHM10263.1 hypothetical protein TheveDRAFT_1139 [Thermanaerovibrio velox DSM 12556]
MGGVSGVLIVGCQNCGRIMVLAGASDPSGSARVAFTCRSCGAGQVLQLNVSSSAEGRDLKEMVLGMAIPSSCPM